jgi:hypothetical protein
VHVHLLPYLVYSAVFEKSSEDRLVFLEQMQLASSDCPVNPLVGAILTLDFSDALPNLSLQCNLSGGILMAKNLTGF